MAKQAAAPTETPAPALEQPKPRTSHIPSGAELRDAKRKAIGVQAKKEQERILREEGRFVSIVTLRQDLMKAQRAAERAAREAIKQAEESAKAEKRRVRQAQIDRTNALKALKNIERQFRAEPSEPCIRKIRNSEYRAERERKRINMHELLGEAAGDRVVLQVLARELRKRRRHSESATVLAQISQPMQGHLLDMANDLKEARQFKQALDVLEPLYLRDPQSPEIAYAMGETYYGMAQHSTDKKARRDAARQAINHLTPLHYRSSHMLVPASLMMAEIHLMLRQPGEGLLALKHIPVAEEKAQRLYTSLKVLDALLHNNVDELYIAINRHDPRPLFTADKQHGLQIHFRNYRRKDAETESYKLGKIEHGSVALLMQALTQSDAAEQALHLIEPCGKPEIDSRHSKSIALAFYMAAGDALHNAALELETSPERPNAQFNRISHFSLREDHTRARLKRAFGMYAAAMPLKLGNAEALRAMSEIVKTDNTIINRAVKRGAERDAIKGTLSADLTRVVERDQKAQLQARDTRTERDRGDVVEVAKKKAATIETRHLNDGDNRAPYQPVRSGRQFSGAGASPYSR